MVIKEKSKISKKKEENRSAALVDKINEVLQKKGHDRHDLQSALDVSYVHINSLMSGVRNFSGLSQEKQRLLAEYLGISFAQYCIYLGILEPGDFFIHESFDQRAQLTFDKMKQDPMWSTMVLSQDEINKLPKRAKLLIALLYEHVSNDSLFDKMDIPDVGKRKPGKASSS